jgi:hypothetical protein
VSRFLISGAAAAALIAGSASAAPTPLAWIITPGEGACTTELELAGRASLVPVTLASDGQVIALRFAKAELPERAFLPIRVDQKRYSSLMLGKPEAGTGELILSQEAEAAMRRGKTLAVAWLGEEPLSGSLAGSEQGLNDLKVCGAQAAAQAKVARETAARAKAEAEERARVQALTDAQLQAARAQAAAADAERQRIADAAERQKREEAEAREQAYRDQRQREYEQARLVDEEERRERAWYEAEQRRRWEAEQAARYAPQPYYPPPAYGRRW